MRKRLITPTPQGASSPSEDWLDLDSAAVVEVTSEEKGYPVESALVSGETQGWRAADSGSQTIRPMCCRPLQAPHSGRSRRCDSHLRGDFLKEFYKKRCQ